MLKMIKSACYWAVSLVQAGMNWIRDNWPAITARAMEMDRQANEVAIGQLRKVVVYFERGMIIGIETVEKRQVMPFKEAFAEARAVVQAMSDEQISNFVAYWFRQEEAATVGA